MDLRLVLHRIRPEINPVPSQKPRRRPLVPNVAPFGKDTPPPSSFPLHQFPIPAINPPNIKFQTELYIYPVN